MNYPGLGTDIQLDDNGNFVLDASGDISLVEDTDCLVQGVIHRMTTFLKGLFYDETFGFDYTQFLHLDADDFNRSDFCQKAKEQLLLEPRIVQGSGSCEVLSWENDAIRFRISLTPIEQTTPLNLVLNANLTDMSVVVEGVNNG